MGESAAGHGEPVEVRVLGPVEVVRDGVPVPLSAGKRQVLLLALALRANRVVSTDRLVDDVWAGSPPAQAEKTLRAHVSALRAAVAGDGVRLRHQQPGYILELPDHRLDVVRFRTLVADARARLASREPDAADRLLGEGLRLWRGQIGHTGEVGPELLGMLAALQEEHLSAVEDGLAAKLALGRHREVIGDIEQLVLAHPLRERARELQMLALYRAGRQADALRAYQAARQALVEQVGVEPSTTLRELEAAILRQDPDLTPAQPLPAVSPAAAAPAAASPAARFGEAPFVGRRAEIAAVRSAIEAASGERGRIVVVKGEPGAGKTRLIDSMAAAASAGGAMVLRGSCDDGRGVPAYWLWTQVLRDLADRRSDRELADELGPAAPDLVALVPELSTRLPVGDGAGGDPEAARFRLFDAAVRTLARAARRQPIVVVLDDLQWCDTSSSELLDFVARRGAPAGLVLIGSWRAGEGDLDRLAALGGLPSVQLVELPGLDVDEVHELLELLTGWDVPRPVALHVWARTGGNPLFVTELARAAPELSALEDAAAKEAPLPGGIRTLLLARIGSVSLVAREALELASVAGRQFSLALLQRAGTMARGQLIAGVDEALGRDLIQPVRGRLDAYQFSHDLVRQAIYDSVPLLRRTELHGRLAEAIEILDPAGSRLEELTHHCTMAASAGGPMTSKAVTLCARAAERATAAHAYEEAARHYDRALEIAQGDPAAAPDAPLLVAAGRARWRAGRPDDARAALMTAAVVARTAGDETLAAEATLSLGGAGVTNGVADEELIAGLRTALHRLPGDADDGLRARLLGRLAMEQYFTAASLESIDVARAAVEHAERAGGGAPLVEALFALHFALRRPNRLEERLAVGRRLLQAAGESGQDDLVIRVHQARVADLLEIGDRPGVEAEIDRCSRLAERAGDLRYQALSMSWRALLEQLNGDFAEAERLATSAYELLAPISPETALQIYGSQLGMLRWEQGRVEEIIPVLEEIVTSFPAAPAWRSPLVLFWSQTGRADRARSGLASLAADGFAELPHDSNWLAAAAVLAVASAELGERDIAAELLRQLEPHGPQYVVVAGVTASACYGSVEYFLGVLADATGDAEAAVRHHRAGIAANRKLGAWPWVARGQAELDRLLLATAAAGGGVPPAPATTVGGRLS